MSRGQPGAFGHRRQFRPHHVGIDRGLADPGAETAIAAGDDVVTSDEVGVAGDALCDQPRVLNEVRFRLDDPGNDDLAVRQLDPLEVGPFMRVNSIGRLRATVTRATITVDWVASYVKIPATNSSSQPCHEQVLDERTGSPVGAKPFARRALYLMLQNRIYRAEIVHKKRLYPGEHTPIIDR